MTEMYSTAAYPSTPQEESNIPQSNSLIADVFIFIAGGMQLAAGLGWSFTANGLQFQYSWFIGVIVGAILSATLTTLLPKRYFLFVSSALVIACSIIFIAAPYKLAALLSARYIGGIGVGFNTVPFVVHGSELASSSYRGMCLSLEQLGLAGGIFLQLLYTALWSLDVGFSSNRLLGIFCLVFGLIALATTFACIESPVFCIRHGNDAAALDSLARLQFPKVLNSAKKLWLERLKTYVRFNEQLSLGESCMQAAVPLMKTLLYRSMLAFTFSLPLTQALQLGTLIVLPNSIKWPSLVYGFLRYLGALASCSLMDTVGRKLFSMLALLVMAALTIAVGAIFRTWNILDGSDNMAAACALLMVAQIFAGIYAPSTTIYMGEAFPLLIKPYCIALCVTVQYAIHIVVVCTYTLGMYNLYVYCVTVGVIMFAGFLVFSVSMPETRGTTLHEAQDLFRKLLHLKCY